MTSLALYRHGPADDGPPLVLLHAFPLDARMWEPVVERLPQLPVLTLDAPGFGSSPDPADLAATRGPGPDLDTYADAVAATLRRTGVERAVVAGVSMGGYAVMALAERHPDLLAGVGLLDTKAEADGDDVRAARLAVADAAEGPEGAAAVAGMLTTVLGETTRQERPDVVDRVREWLAQAPPAGIAWAQRAMAARPDRTAALADLAVPALVLRGAEDAGAPQPAAEAMAAALGDAEVVVVPRAGHLSPLEDPAAVATALERLHARCR